MISTKQEVNTAVKSNIKWIRIKKLENAIHRIKNTTIKHLTPNEIFKFQFQKH